MVSLINEDLKQLDFDSKEVQLLRKKNQIIGSPPALQSLFHVLAFKTISFYIIGISLFTDMFLTSNKAYRNQAREVLLNFTL